MHETPPSAAPSRRLAANRGRTRRTLSPARRRLLALMQGINFGRIERLVVRDGEPVFDPAPRVVREIKFGGENGPRPEVKAQDFVLKAQTVELFTSLGRLGDGTVECIEVQHGLPFRMKVEEVLTT